MFVALRDLRAARGRFALITLVVVLVAILVSFLSGLTSGLAHQNVSALRKISGDTVVFADTGTAPSFDSSALTADQVRAWRQAAPADPVGISRARATRDGGPPVQVALFGSEGATFGNRSATSTGSVVLSAPAARNLSATAGDHIMLGNATFVVAAVGDDDWYAHTPVVWTTLPDWRALTPHGGAATILVTSGVPDASAVNAAAHTVTTSASDSLRAIGSYRAEHSSLTLMTILLYAISALVIGAFFTVWTIQRSPDIAILKALGATTGSLVADALGQALIVLLTGVGIGLAITSAAGTALDTAMPFVLSAATTLAPGAALIALGLLGAAVALRFVATADPLTALDRTR
ncbi:ABC transporter permease [Nocardia vaccinii]|uniref:ABC transporter permease n=1 Tax=Nocardia vaccinii TaxID=1822 RepID=UPI00082DA722|nr:ABC transporter permease [Nocardia vaccinii]